MNLDEENTSTNTDSETNKNETIGAESEKDEIFTPRKKKISFKAIGIAAVVLAIIITAGYFISQNNSDKFSEAKALYEAQDYDGAYAVMVKIKDSMGNNFEFITIYSDLLHRKELFEEEFNYLLDRGENTTYREGVANLVQTRYDDLMGNESVSEDIKQKIEKLIQDYLEGKKK